ncbi:Cyclin PHO80-like protein [Abortiporus biennis]
MSSSIHLASLVQSALHSPALLELLDTKLAQTLLDYLVDHIIETVHCALLNSSSSSAHGRLSARERFSHFVRTVVYRAEVKIPVLLVALCYIDRAKPQLHIAVEQWAYERVFLGAIVLAYKYSNDATLKNFHWAVCTGVFGSRDIGRIEREFLDVLDYNLSVTEDDILVHHPSIMSLVIHSASLKSQAPVYIQSLVAPQNRKVSQTLSSSSSSASSMSDSGSDSDFDSDSESYYESPITPDSTSFPVAVAAPTLVCSQPPSYHHQRNCFPLGSQPQVTVTVKPQSVCAEPPPPTLQASYTSSISSAFQFLPTFPFHEKETQMTSNPVSGSTWVAGSRVA